jgi:hypothetical protein
VVSQNLTFSPYSRYGIGEINSNGFGQIHALAGTGAAFKPDTVAPLFINIVNPASISNIRVTTLELGGIGNFSDYSNGISKVRTKTANFSYGALGFPVRKRAGICVGILPYSNVGYNLRSDKWNGFVNDYVTEKYSGEGGINKVFFGLGINPFKQQLYKFNHSAYRDSLMSHHEVKKYKRVKFAKELLSDLSIGGRADYLFGNTLHTSSVIFPGSVSYYNTRRYRAITYKDVTASFGLQTSFVIDSVRKKKVNSKKHFTFFSGDSVQRYELKNKIRIAFGYYMSIPNTIMVKNSYLAYNYSLNSFGDEIPKDTFIYVIDQSGSIRLPLEQTVGMSIKKGEVLNIAADLSYTNWQQFRFLDKVNDLKNSYRVSFGINYVPNKFALGKQNYYKRVNYRIGAFYNNGYLELNKTEIVNYAVTVGFGFPVGVITRSTNNTFLVNTVNISAHFGKMGTIQTNLIEEKYIKLVVGFTFNDKWFNKVKFD